MKLYRGSGSDYWATRLVNRGWPLAAAKRMAAFLVNEEPAPPQWDDLRPEPDMVPVIGTVPYKPEPN